MLLTQSELALSRHLENTVSFLWGNRLKLIFAVSFLATLAAAASASEEDRPALALQLFEDVCLPIVHGRMPSELGTMHGEVQYFRGAQKATSFSWPHEASGFEVKVVDYLDGRIKCDLNDHNDVLTLTERERFERIVAEWMPLKMPMLEQQTPDPMSDTDYFNTWIDTRFPYGDRRRWGVLHFRFGENLGGTTSLGLAFIRPVPVS
ncbi:hypothetical protein [uncultured Shimia sp.]|uniref:hypothetical protein n=1 Tax=uncultured Shimia sp. TaxID=573152 RepID=UPI0025E1FF95|nr:hypothetical protein [uncultured Shimia sp.]